MHRRRAAAAVMAGALAALCTSPPPAAAHGPPTPLAFWGAFGRRVARCQRLIAEHAAVCALRAWEARRACRLAALHGGVCDEDATDRVIEAARIDAVDGVGAACTDNQAQTLIFLDRREAQTDVVTFCRELEDAVDSAVFRPSTAALPSQTRRCIESASLVASKLLRQSFKTRQRVLDRIAMLSVSVAKKNAMIAASGVAIADDAVALERSLSAACPGPAFADTYGRDAAAFLATITARADCLAGQTYAQGGVVCPTPECGNGMIEFQPIQDREECDDGNIVNGDGCSADCVRE